jgi:FSR family fosmidomycin resistance protein-like MFS transporter
MTLLRPADSATVSPAARRDGLAALVADHAINDAYTLAVPPLLPAIQQSFALSYSAVSIVPFLTLATSALLQPTLGYLADRHTLRRAFMAGGFLALALGMLALWRSGSYLGVLAAAVLLGIGASTYHPQSATLLTYYFERRNRGFAQGVHGIGNAIGFAGAPLLMAFLLARMDWHRAAAWMALPAGLGAAIVLFALREPASRGGAGLFAGITRPLVLLTLANGLALATSQSFVTWLPTYYVGHHFDLSRASLLTVLTSGAAFLAQPLGGSLSDRIGRRNLIVVALSGTAVSLALFLLAPGIGWAIALSVLVGFCTSLTPPVMMVYASELARGERTGVAVGVVWGLATTISAISLPVTGRIIDLAGGQIGPAYLALVVAAALGALISSRLPREK